MKSTSTVDIVIVNYRSAVDTLNALSLLSNWQLGMIWVVDNSAHDPSTIADTANLANVILNYTKVRLLSPGENLGFGRACNLAFEQSNADFILLLNPDACISATDILQLVKTIESDSKLAAVSPVIYWNATRSFVLPVATPQTPWRMLASVLSTRSRFLARWIAIANIHACMRLTTSRHLLDVSFLSGAVLLLRRKALAAVGGLFDPIYFMFFEDSDLSLRLGRQGYKLAVVPTASAVHEYRHKAYKAAMMAKSHHQYFSKNYSNFYIWSKRLRRVSILSKEQILSDWFWTLPEPVGSAGEFKRLTEGKEVVAFSPSTTMIPAVCRPSTAATSCFSEEEWAQLEPASYVALLTDATNSKDRAWIYFTKA